MKWSSFSSKLSPPAHRVPVRSGCSEARKKLLKLPTYSLASSLSRSLKKLLDIIINYAQSTGIFLQASEYSELSF